MSAPAQHYGAGLMPSPTLLLATRSAMSGSEDRLKRNKTISQDARITIAKNDRKVLLKIL
jgi:hypothetical protein